MNRDDEFTHALEAWLRRKAPPQAPDRVLETALERVNSESQGQSWRQSLFGTTAMGSLLRVAAVTAVVALAVLAGQRLSNLVPDVGESSPSPTTEPSPSTSPTETPPAGCVNPPTDVTTLIDMEPTGPLDPGGDPVACYRNTPLTFEATWLGGGVADCPAAPEPAWLACSSFSLQAAGDTRKVGAPQLFVAIDPSVSLSLSEPYAQVRVTGHFDDPAAQTCRETALGGGATTLAPAAEMIEGCRRTFVVTEVIPLDLAVPNVLAPDTFARVLAETVNVREEPGIDAPTLSIPQGGDNAIPMRPVLGTAGGSEHVYILEGPVAADGFEWFRIAPIKYEFIEMSGPPFVGWVAAGDGVDPWLVPENPCPAGPVILEDLTHTSTTTNWATRLGCFRGEELTLRGWYPSPPEIGFEGPCPSEPAFLMCSGIFDIRPIEMSYYDERSASRLEFAVQPDSGIVMPPREQWIEITGHWDDPASASCPIETVPWDSGILSCRMQFVVTSVRALGAEI